MSISGYALNKAAIFDRKENDGTLMTVGKFATSRAVYPVIVLTGLVEALPSALLSLVFRLPFYLFSSNRFSFLTNHTYDSLRSAKDAFIKIFTFYLARAPKAPAVVQTPIAQPQPAEKPPALQLAPATLKTSSTPPAPVEEPPVERSYFQSAVDTVNNNPKIFLLAGVAVTAFALWYLDLVPKFSHNIGAHAAPLHATHVVNDTCPLRVDNGDSINIFELPSSIEPEIFNNSSLTAPSPAPHFTMTQWGQLAKPEIFDNRSIIVGTSELFNPPVYEETRSLSESIDVIDAVTSVAKALLAVPILLFGGLSLMND